MIVFIDDDTQILEVLNDFFSDLYEVKTFDQPWQALRFIEDNKKLIEVCVLDYKMPTANGIELAKKIRAVDSNIMLVLMSGFVDFPTIEEHLKSRLIYQFINKPFVLERMAQTIETASKIYLKKISLL
ncbi:MAG: response regulator [Chloroherpetonaceae bacterium]